VENLAKRNAKEGHCTGSTSQQSEKKLEIWWWNR